MAIGQAVAMVDSRDRVTGRIDYVLNFEVPGMLHARLLRSPHPHARLVRVGSRFWLVGGVDVNLGLFRGLEVNVGSLRTLVAGGIAFATPDDPGSPPVKDGTLFLLHEKPQIEWLDWLPRIPVPAAG